MNFEKYFGEDYRYYKKPIPEKLLKFRYDYIRKACPGEHWKKILFVGCGKGELVRYFRNKGYDAYGVDISNHAIESCHSSIKDYVFCEDICNMKRFKENEFDVISSWTALHIIDRTKRHKAIKKIVQLANRHIVVRLFVSGSMIVPKIEPFWHSGDCIHDGAPVYLEPSDYWIRLFEKFGKFRLKKVECNGLFLQSFFLTLWRVQIKSWEEVKSEADSGR